MTINPTSIYKVACFLQLNGSTESNRIRVDYVNATGWVGGTIDVTPVANEWNLIESTPIFRIPIGNEGTVRIHLGVNAGNALAIEYLVVYDTQITDENCVPIITTTTTAPQICQWEPGQEIAIGSRCDVQHGYFVFQLDGNAVIYNESDVAIWNTRTAGIGHSFVFETNGNLAMYSNTGSAVWESASQDRGGSLLVFQQDRNLVIYNTVNVALWKPGTYVS